MTTTTVPANGIEIAYESFGSPQDRPLLLIMGLGSQMILWDEEFCARLAGRGHHVVRFDNRDVGLSTHLHEAGPADLASALAGTPFEPAYLLSDMADDTAALMDALGWEAAHIVGASMGGMIAQEFAIRHTERVLTLTSIMSTPGKAGPPTPAAGAALLSPPATSREEAVAGALAAWQVIGSPGYPPDPEHIAARAGRSYDRAHDPAGVGRQLAAILASGDRSERLAKLDLPALVIHGEQDPLVQLAGGQATAEAIPGARLVTYPGMGHDLPKQLWDPIIDEIARLTAS